MTSSGVARRLGTLFPDLPLEARRRLADACELHRCDRATTLPSDDNLVLVLNGHLTLLAADGTELVQLQPGTTTAGAPPEGTTLRASARSAHLDVDPDVLAEVLRDAPAHVHDRLLADANRVLLAGHLLRTFGPGIAGAIPATLDVVTWRTLSGNEVLFERGDEATAAYVVVTGRLVADLHGGGRSEHLPGTLVGDLALLVGEPRAATVSAARDSEVAVIDGTAFLALADEHPALVLAVARELLKRVRRVRSSPTSTVIAIRPGHEGVDVGTLAARLRRALEPHGSVTVCDRQRATHVLGDLPTSAENGYAEHRLRGWLDDLQRTHRFVILGTSATGDAWDERVTRSADLVLTAVHIDHTPNGAAHATAGDLVVLHGHGASGLPDTAAWVGALEPDRVHHVREARADDLSRLARFLAGRAVGLVLGGGGARGFSQIGVYRALHELGVEIDIVGGTSIGAVMASGPASEFTPEQFEDMTETSFHKLLDYTVPLVSMLRAERLTRSMRLAYADHVITDLWRPYYAVSTSLTTSLSRVHDRGSVVTALRASVSIPGVMPPVPVDGELLIDGGILDNLPLGPMRERNPTGPVIAVDVAPPSGPRAKQDYGMSLAGSKVLRSRMGRGGPIKAPGLAATLMRSTLVGASARRDEEIACGMADLHLDLDVRGAGMLEFERVREISSLGYEQAAPRIEAWLAAGGLNGTRDG